MKDYIERLWDIQMLWNQEEDLQRQKNVVPQMGKQEEIKGRIREGEEKGGLAAKKLKNIERHLHQLETELKQREDEKNTLEHELYESGHGNIKELCQMEKRLEQIKDTIVQDEERIYELIEKKEALEAYKTKLSGVLEGLKTKIIKWQAKWEEDQKSLDEKIGLLAEQIRDVIEQIPENVLEDFKKRYIQNRGRAITLLNGDFCGECGIQLPSSFVQRVKYSSELQFCNNCGRILYWKD